MSPPNYCPQNPNKQIAIFDMEEEQIIKEALKRGGFYKWAAILICLFG